MRARLHKYWPSIARQFGLYPDDIPRFSVEEWNQYIQALNEGG